jgi:hypothetical protein
MPRYSYSFGRISISPRMIHLIASALQIAAMAMNIWGAARLVRVQVYSRQGILKQSNSLRSRFLTNLTAFQ